MKMAEDSSYLGIYCGTWKIVEFMSTTTTAENMDVKGIEGTEFRIDDSGDIWWKIAEGVAEIAPFCYSETFEIVSHGNKAVLKLFGSDAGHLMEFEMELSADLLLLTYESWFMLQCQRVSDNDPKIDYHFAFINALEDGYFSDLSIVADSGKEFKVHKTILWLSVPQLDFNQVPGPLSGLPEDVIHTVLHYLYSECLPASLSEDTAKSCVQAVGKLPGLTRLVDLCEMFLKNNALKQQIISLVTDMHNCASRIVDYFSGKPVECSNSPSHAGTGGAAVNTSASDKSGGGDSLASNPAKLCYVLKQSLRECALAGAKLLILCDLFARRKNELSRVERHEIIKYTKSRLPVFMHQLHKLLEVTRQMFSDMPASQRHDIAMYLVPQIEAALETMSQFVVETRNALEQIISTSNSAGKAANQERSGNKPVREVLGKSLRQVLHIREVTKLRNFYDKISLNFMNLLQKKANFANMTSAIKVRSVAKNLEQGIDEIPLFLLRLEDLIEATDETLTWREWKYTFKLGTSKVSWMLQKLVGHSPALRTMIMQVCDLVHRDQFTQSMITLGLLDPQVDQEGSPVTSATATATSSTARLAAPSSPPTSKRLNTLESLSVPPLARESNLAKSAVHLLKSERESDMIFEIISVEDVSDTVIDHTLEGEPVGHTTQEQEVQMHSIKSHQVIVASRCDWFRRALLSGMRESIDKKIVVHDTNPALFKVFLEYLYGGTLDVASLTTEQLADLMLLSDRYEVDSLKSVTEMTLKRSINHDSALFLLSIADQFNAKSLRSAALDFVASSPEIMESEVFSELPDDLQGEVEFLATWGNPPSYQRPDAATAAHKSHRTDESRRGPCPLHQCPYDNNVEDMISNMRLTNREVDPSDSSSLEDVPLTQDSSQLEACVAQLREIIGESVPHEELVRISLAADYDVNRALNFFYT